MFMIIDGGRVIKDDEGDLHTFESEDEARKWADDYDYFDCLIVEFKSFT